MKITFRTAGLLVRFMPSGAAQAEIEVADGATPRDVMTQLGFPLDDPYLVLLNGASVPRAERPTLKLGPGDTLAIMPPLKGG